MTLLLLSSSLLAARVAAGYDIRIRSASDLILFSNNVNHGVFYRGVSVYLESDIDLTPEFTPIGNDPVNYFPGVFDGQGHTITGLTTNTTSPYAGLFGYSSKITVRNVIVDGFLSFVSETANDVYSGGVIGCCRSIDGPCIIENSVLTGGVTHIMGVSNRSAYVGGIAGELGVYGHRSAAKNCANYGSVAHKGTSTYSYVGGIVGHASGATSIHNCANCGSVTRDDATKFVYIGGIAGSCEGSSIENCVNAGLIASGVLHKHIGTIVGRFAKSYLSHCYWDEDTNHKISGNSVF